MPYNSKFILFLGLSMASVMVDLTGLLCLERNLFLIHITSIQEVFRGLVSGQVLF